MISSNPFLHDFVRKPTTELLNTHDLHSELETSLPFSLAKPYQLAMVGSLGFVNFIGVAVLGNLLRANTATRSVILSQFPGSLLARVSVFYDNCLLLVSVITRESLCSVIPYFGYIP